MVVCFQTKTDALLPVDSTNTRLCQAHLFAAKLLQALIQQDPVVIHIDVYYFLKHFCFLI